jgi:hypothetical protein
MFMMGARSGSTVRALLCGNKSDDYSCNILTVQPMCLRVYLSGFYNFRVIWSSNQTRGQMINDSAYQLAE